MNKVKSFFSNSIYLINIGCILWLALCLLASIISPEEVRYLQLFSLTTPFAILINFLFFLFWIFSAKKLRSIPSLLILLGCYQVIPAIFGFHFFTKNNWQQEPNSFKLVSWNTHGMGIFNKSSQKKTATEIVDYLLQQDADILVLPEFSVKAITESSIHKSRLQKEGGYKNYYFTMDNGLGADLLIGTSIFSRFPVINYQGVFLDPNIAISYSDVVFPSHDTARLFAVHLHTFGLTDNDKSYIEEVKKRKAEGLKKSRSFLWKFNNAYALRAQEADKLAGYISESPYPVLVCGDFNDLPFSYTYATIRGNLDDAFSEMGRGFGRTYNQIVPTLRIDHVFFDPALFELTAFETPYVSLSDHSPILTRFRLKK